MKMKLPALDYYKVLKHFTIGVDVLFLALILFNYLNYLPEFWIMNITYVFFFVVAINTAFLALKIKKIPENQRDQTSIVYLSKYFFLLGLIVIVLNQFLKRQIIIDYMTYITGIIIALGFLTFYSSRERVEKEIEDEKQKEDNAEQKRKDEFSHKFPRINKILGLRSIVKWMYKEGWSFSIPFVIIAIIFIAIKIGMPIIYTESYMDEYTHIFSGIEFFKTGHFAEIYKGEFYNRGAYVSFLVGLFFKLFGQTIFVAKMVPALIGIIDFFLLYFIARQVIEKKIYILLLMIIYTISPWVIFNHFYIRMYVFYEFFVLFLTFLFILFIKNIRNIKKLRSYSILIVIILIIVYSFSYDFEKYLILFYSLIFLVYIYLFEIQKISFKNNLSRSLSKNNILKIILFIVLFLGLFFYLEGLSLIQTFTSGDVTFTTSKDFKYDNLFFNLNISITSLFLISFLTLPLKKVNIYCRLIIFSSLVLFLLHYSSSLDLQMTRVILYFFPLYYLVAIITYQMLTSSNLLKVFILLSIFLSILISFPVGFIDNGPHIEGEIINIDYASSYNFVSNYCSNRVIYVLHHNPDIPLFYNVSPDYINYLDFSRINRGGIYYLSADGLYRTTYGNIKVISDYNLIKDILNREEKVCIILRSNSIHNSRYITKEDEELLMRNFIINRFEEINVYMN